jgi:hypothetical protein
MRLALGFLGLTQLAIGVWLIVSPDSFVDTVADFGPADNHFLRDLGTFQSGMGIALLAAVGRPAWRVPVLFAALAQSALHTVNHLFDIANTDPGWQGPVNFAGVLLLTGAFAYLMQEAGRDTAPGDERDARPPRAERLPA